MTGTRWRVVFALCLTALTMPAIAGDVILTSPRVTLREGYVGSPEFMKECDWAPELPAHLVEYSQGLVVLTDQDLQNLPGRTLRLRIMHSPPRPVLRRRGPEQRERHLADGLHCSGVVGLNEQLGALAEVVVLPNPVHDRMIVRIVEATGARGTLDLRDVLGQRALGRDLGLLGGERTEVLDVELLASGLYFLEITFGGTHSVHRIIKR